MEFFIEGCVRLAGSIYMKLVTPRPRFARGGHTSFSVRAEFGKGAVQRQVEVSSNVGILLARSHLLMPLTLFLTVGDAELQK